MVELRLLKIRNFWTGTLSMTVESTALAVSEFYDKALAQTLDFVRLKATGPIIPTTAVPYTATLDMAVIYGDEVEPLSGTEGGVTLGKLVARLSVELVTSKCFSPITVCTLAALP